MIKKIENVLNDIEQQGWSIQENYFSTTLIKQLNETLTSLQHKNCLKKAGILIYYNLLNK